MTTIQKLIEDIIEIDKRNVNLTNKGFITILENALSQERKQIEDAFNEGVKYGNSDFQTFDYPSSRYYSFTYNTFEE